MIKKKKKRRIILQITIDATYLGDNLFQTEVERAVLPDATQNELLAAYKALEQLLLDYSPDVSEVACTQMRRNNANS